MSLTFSTKAGTLAVLQGVLNSARIAPLRAFTVADWQVNRQACLAGVVEDLGSAPWIVRSSCSREDGAESSNAGAFLSIPNVLGAGLESAVEQVIAAYGKAHPSDEVLIQPMLTQVVLLANFSNAGVRNFSIKLGVAVSVVWFNRCAHCWAPSVA